MYSIGDYINDSINESQQQTNEVNNDIKKAEAIETTNENSSYGKQVWNDVVNSIGLGFISGLHADSNMLDPMGNEDSTVVGNIGGLVAGFGVGKVIGVGENILSDVYRAAMYRSSNIVDDAVAQALVKNRNVINKSENIGLKQKLIEKTPGTIGGATMFTATSVTTTNNLEQDKDGNFKMQTHTTDPFSEEGLVAMITNGLPAGVLMSGGYIHSKLKKEEIEQAKKQQIEDSKNKSRINLDDDNQYHNFVDNVTKTVANEDGDSNVVKYSTFDGEKPQTNEDGSLTKHRSFNENTTENITNDLVKSEDPTKELDNFKIFDEVNNENSKLNETDKQKLNSLKQNIEDNINKVKNTKTSFEKEKAKKELESNIKELKSLEKKAYTKIEHHTIVKSRKFGDSKFTKVTSNKTELANANISMNVDNLFSDVYKNKDNKRSAFKHIDNFLKDNEEYNKLDNKNKKEIKQKIFNFITSNRNKSTEFKEHLKDIFTPDRYVMEQRGENLNLGYHYVSIRSKDGVEKNLLTLLGKKSSLGFTDKEVLNNNDLFNSRLDQVNNIVKHTIYSISKVSEENINNLSSTNLIKHIISEINKDNSIKFNNHIVGSLAINASGTNINIDDSDLDKINSINDTGKEELNKAIQDFITDNNLDLTDLSRNLQNETFDKRITLNKIKAYLVMQHLDNLNEIKLDAFDNDNIKEILGDKFIETFKQDLEDIKNIIQSSEDSVNNYLGLLSDLKVDENGNPISTTNIINNLYEDFVNNIENTENLDNIIKTVMENDSSANINNLLLSITKEVEDNYGNKRRIFTDEYKTSLKFAITRSTASLLNNIDHKTTIDENGNVKTIVFLKEDNEVNLQNLNSNILKKSLDIFGLVSSNGGELDKLKNTFSDLFAQRIPQNTILQNTLTQLDSSFDPTVNGLIAELDGAYNRVFKIIETKQTDVIQANVNLKESKNVLNDKTTSVSNNTTMNSGQNGQVNVSIEVNGIKQDMQFNNINEARAYQARLIDSLEDNRKKYLLNTYTNIIRLNDYLDPIDKTRNLIKNDKDILNSNKKSDYLTNDSKATLSVIEDTMAKTMANTKIRFKSEDEIKEIKHWLDDIFIIYDGFMNNNHPLENRQLSEDEKVIFFARVYNKLFDPESYTKITGLKEIEPSDFKSMKEVEAYFGSDIYNHILTTLSEYKREYDVINTFKNTLTDIEVSNGKIETEASGKTKISLSGRFMTDLKVSHQSNKFSKHFIDFSAGDENALLSIDHKKTALYFKSSIRTALDELGADDFIDDKSKFRYELPTKEGEEKKYKIDYTKSNNNNLIDHYEEAKEYLKQMDGREAELNMDQLRYYFPLKHMIEMIEDPNNIGQIKTAIRKARPILEIDGAQNVAGTINALLSIHDNSTGIGGKPMNANGDIYTRFVEVVGSAVDNTGKKYLKNIIEEAGSVKRNDAKKPAQATLYDQSTNNTAIDFVEMFLQKLMFNKDILISENKDQSNIELGKARLYLLNKTLIQDEQGLTGLIDNRTLNVINDSANEIIDKINKLQSIKNVIESGLRSAQTLENLKNTILQVINQNELVANSLISQLNIKTVGELTNLIQSMDQRQISELTGKIDAAISSSLSNKDFLEVLKYKLEGTIQDRNGDVVNNIKNNTKLKIAFFKAIENKLLEQQQNNKINVEAKQTTFERQNPQDEPNVDNTTKSSGKVNIPRYDLLLNELYSTANSELTNTTFLKNLATDVSNNAGLGEKLQDSLNNHEYFKHLVKFKNTIDDIYTFGQAVTLKRLNSKVPNYEALLNRIYREIDVSNEVKNKIAEKLGHNQIGKENKTYTYKQIADTLYQFGVSPLRSETFIKESQIPFMYTPDGRKLLFVTEKSVNLDENGMQGKGIALVNKPLTYFIQSTESGTLSRAVSRVKPNGIIQRFDAVYGVEGLEVGKEMNKIYNDYTFDLNYFNSLKTLTNSLIEEMQDSLNDPNGLDELANEIAKQKILLNEGVTGLSEEKMQQTKQKIRNKFEINFRRRKEIDRNTNSVIESNTRTNHDTIVSKLDELYRFKRDNLGKMLDENNHIISNNQFSNGLDYFEDKIKLENC